MSLTSLFFNFIFYRNTSSLVFYLNRDECINYCSSFLINALPVVEDMPFIKETKTALLLETKTDNELRIQRFIQIIGWLAIMSHN